MQLELLGVDNSVGTGTLDAANNYWGDASGPYVAVDHECGLGDKAIGDVDFCPFYKDAALTDSDTSCSCAPPSSGHNRHAETCPENWQCDSWGACSRAGARTRNCVDANACGTTANKPAEIESCTPAGTPPPKILPAPEPEELLPAPIPQPAMSKYVIYGIIAGIILALAGLAYFFFVVRRRITLGQIKKRKQWKE
jgi:hypothetical protein